MHPISFLFHIFFVSFIFHLRSFTTTDVFLFCLLHFFPSPIASYSTGFHAIPFYVLNTLTSFFYHSLFFTPIHSVTSFLSYTFFIYTSLPFPFLRWLLVLPLLSVDTSLPPSVSVFLHHQPQARLRQASQGGTSTTRDGEQTDLTQAAPRRLSGQLMLVGLLHWLKITILVSSSVRKRWVVSGCALFWGEGATCKTLLL